MYTLLVRLMFLAALVQLGISAASVDECGSWSCFLRLEKASRQVLKVDWKPISVFPEEARWFR